MAKAGRIYIPRSVSFPPHLLKHALERAGNLGLPFSAYIQKCVERDLRDRPAIVFAEKQEALSSVAAESPGRYRSASPRQRRKRRPREAAS